MDSVGLLVAGLRDKDAKQAYLCLKQLQAESEKTNAVYGFFDDLSEMLDDANSYIRTRAIVLIAANARWDTDNKIDRVIGQYLRHVEDEKPITARQCIQALPEIARHKPALSDAICRALRDANPMVYAESMAALIIKDIEAALAAISMPA